jgi:hypothetical protein
MIVRDLPLLHELIFDNGIIPVQIVSHLLWVLMKYTIILKILKNGAAI